MKRVFIRGNVAIAEASLVAGLKFYAGYPITPTSDIMEYLHLKLPRYGGLAVQFEDEIASINAIIGASWAGAKSMTATSGPGFSLMLEGLSLAHITETPIVVVYVMRTGPATGVPTRSGQADILQARFGAHGDYITPIYAPSSVQEAFDLTIKAFNTAEKLRTPVILLSDAVIAHLWENMIFRDRDEVEIIERKRPNTDPSNYLPYKPEDDGVAPMAEFGKGYHILVESLTHDERGYYVPTTEVQRRMIERITKKILLHIDYVYEQKTYLTDDADYIIVSYGSSSRTAKSVVNDLRARGVKIGLLDIKTLWPLNEYAIKKVCESCTRIFVLENNIGKFVWDIQRIVRDIDVIPVSIIDLDLPDPDEALKVIEKWL
uniref:2-oxoacid oxidoreductase (ferredoxin) n=1 Tax=Staphylothermus marinus TaxID=2280 RepID=A0A7C4NNA8_STAMA